MSVLLRKVRSAGIRLRQTFLSQRFGFSPSQIYGHEFYHGPGCSTGSGHAGTVASMLVDHFHPRSIFDFGSGNGALLHAMRGHGVEAYGCEGSVHGVKLSPDDIIVFQADLKRPVELNRVFDLTFCVEVAEHLPARSADTLVASICAATGRTVLFSASGPGQYGDDHINLQPAEYWAGKFARRGMVSDPSTAELFRAAAIENRIPLWYRNTIVLHKRSTA